MFFFPFNNIIASHLQPDSYPITLILSIIYIPEPVLLLLSPRMPPRKSPRSKDKIVVYPDDKDVNGVVSLSSDQITVASLIL